MLCNIIKVWALLMILFTLNNINTNIKKIVSYIEIKQKVNVEIKDNLPLSATGIDKAINKITQGG